jgi:hypothetical protein
MKCVNTTTLESRLVKLSLYGLCTAKNLVLAGAAQHVLQ